MCLIETLNYIVRIQKFRGFMIPRAVFVENIGVEEGEFGVRGGNFGDKDTVEIFLVEHHGFGMNVEGVREFRCTAFVDQFQGKVGEALEVKLGFGVEIVHENAFALCRVEQDKTNGHVLGGFWGWLGEFGKFGAGCAHLLV